MELPLAAELTTGAEPLPMRAALAQALAAKQRGEVPVGAVVVDAHGNIIAADGNRCEANFDATAHAEMLVLRAASRHLGRWRLHGCSLWVTLEPCRMCAGAVGLARIDKVVFAAFEPRTGALVSGPAGFEPPPPIGGPQIIGGVMATAAQALLAGFFADLRSQAKDDKQRRQQG